MFICIHVLNNPPRHTDPTGHDSISGTGTYWYQDLTVDEALAIIAFIEGIADHLYHASIVLGVISFASLGLALITAGPTAGLGTALSTIVSAITALGGIALTQLANSLQNIKEYIEAALWNGADKIRIEVYDEGLLDGRDAQIIGFKDGSVIYQRRVPIGLLDPTDEFLLGWMRTNDLTYQAKYHKWWMIGGLNLNYNLLGGFPP